MFLKTYDGLINSPDLVGKTTYIRQNTNWAYSNHMTRIRLRKDVAFAGWVAYVLHYLFLAGYFKLNCRHHVNQASIGTGFLTEKLFIPLPPLSEQERIVRRIESLFSRLEAGVAGLKRTRAALKRYRLSVLKAACEGRLVANSSTAPLQGNGLPVGWQRATIGEIGKISGGITKNSKRDALRKKLPYLRVANVYANELRLDDVSEIGVDESKIKRALLQDGDLLVVEGNGSADQIGRVALWNGSIAPMIHQNHIIKVRFEPTEIGKYILYWLLSDSGRKQITNVASSTSGLYTLSLSKVSQLHVPLPSLAEQRLIVAEIERRLSVVQEVEAAVQANLARAARLRQAILKLAFEGRMV